MNDLKHRLTKKNLVAVEIIKADREPGGTIKE